MRPAGKGGIKILVVTGSSGGHIFPALSLLESLKEKAPDMESLLILPRRSIKNQLGNLSCPTSYLSFSPVKFNLGFSNIVSILKLFKVAAEELVILLRFRPRIVVGFGSLVTLPLIMFARASGRKILIHEQNLIPGKANRFAVFFANRIALSFSATANYLKCSRQKIVLTGNPLRRQMQPVERLAARDYFGLSRDRFTILVSGGSQGSRSINSGFLKIISSLAGRYHIQVVHLSGEKDYEMVLEQYRKINIEARVFKFSDAMPYAYSCADLVIARSGATTIAELMLFKIPALLVPYPYAYNHQLANARVLADRGCAFILDDAEFAAGQSRGALEDILNNSQELERLRNNYQGLDSLGARERLCDAVLALI